MNNVTEDLQVVALIKGKERYVFMYHDDHAGRLRLLTHLGIFAANPDLSFTWKDAAVLAKKVIR